MYSARLQTLVKAYKNVERNNATYTEALKNLSTLKTKLSYVNGLAAALTMLEAIIAQQETKWQDSVLRALEAEIVQALSFVYPTDGYTVSLSARVYRGKIRVEGTVRSYFTNEMPGELSESQGCLFQQIVSFAALVQIMKILGVDTVYIDEAFSGVARTNIPKINRLLQHYKEQGCNIIMIAQDTNIALGIEANTLILERSLGNKTTVHRRGGVE